MATRCRVQGDSRVCSSVVGQCRVFRNVIGIGRVFRNVIGMCRIVTKHASAIPAIHEYMIPLRTQRMGGLICRVRVRVRVRDRATSSSSGWHSYVVISPRATRCRRACAGNCTTTLASVMSGTG